MPNSNIAYLLKFAPKEAYIDDLLNGRDRVENVGVRAAP